MADFEAAAQEVQEAREQNTVAKEQEIGLQDSLEQVQGLIEEAKKLASVKGDMDEFKRKAWGAHIVAAAAVVHVKSADETSRYDESDDAVQLLEDASGKCEHQVGLLRETERLLTETVANIDRLEELTQEIQASIVEAVAASDAAEEKLETLANRI